MVRPPDTSPGEEFKFNKYLVEIVSRRLEGKSAVKSLSKKATPSKQSASTKESINAAFSKSRKTGLLNGTKNAIGSASTGSFKPF